MNTKERKERFLEGLARDADAKPAEFGFKRTPRSTRYVREVDGVKQGVDVGLQFPRRMADFIAESNPVVSLAFREKRDFLGRMETATGRLRPRVDYSYPMGYASTANAYVVWQLFEDTEMDAFVCSVAEGVVRLGIPFFDSHRSIEDVAGAVGGAWIGDKQVRLVAACMLHVGRPEEALKLIEARFGPPSKKRRREPEKLEVLEAEALVALGR